MTFNSRRHITSLDGWRGVAILLVFLCHYFPVSRHNLLSTFASLGWSGVDLFFVLSGFLITGILWDSRTSEHYLGTFYKRRALRLFPVYLAAVFVVIVGTGFLRGQRSWLDIPMLVYGANLAISFGHMSHTFGQFNVSHFWSLAVEEQFYSLWPFLLLLTPRKRSAIRLCIVGIGIAIALRIVVAIVGADGFVAYENLATRMDGLLAGAILALALRSPVSVRVLNPVRLRWMLAISAAALLGVVCVAHTTAFTNPLMFTAGYSAITSMSVSLLAMAMISGTVSHRIGSSRILRFFGRYSYGFYVWHYLFEPTCIAWIPAFRAHIHPQLVSDIVYTIAMLCLFTGCAVASYWLIEVHFLRLKSKVVPAARVEQVLAA